MLFNILISLMGLAVVFGAVCRLDIFSPVKHNIWWGLMYVCVAAFAVSAACNQVREAFFFGLTSWGLNFLLTKKLWAEGPPPSVDKPTT